MKFRIAKAILLSLFVFPAVVAAQIPPVENALFWEISGNGIDKPSYLYGTNHLLDSRHVDTLGNVNRKFADARTVVSEVIFDSTQMAKMVSAAIMRDSSLHQLLPQEWYDRAESWLKELSQYESLAPFNKLKPVALQVMLVNLIHIQLYGQGGIPMDAHLQNKAKAAGKKLVSLETIDDQLHALFSASSNARQADMLIEFLKTKNGAGEELAFFHELYLGENIAGLESKAKETYLQEEMYLMLYRRNENWINLLPSVIIEGNCFIAVGALHLAGDSGLVSGLRNLGFTVRPISLE